MPIFNLFKSNKYIPVDPAVSADSKVSNSLKKKPDPLETMDPSFRKAIIPCLRRPQCDTTFEAISGLESAKKELKLAAVWPFVNPGLFTGFAEPTKGVLLYGLPSSGKTLLAQALAKESKAFFITVNASTLTCENCGKMDYDRCRRLMKSLFEVARYNKPSILFIDEIDCLLSKCNTDEYWNYDTQLLWTQFFESWQSKQSNGVLTLAATNKPHLLDEATLRRFPKRIFIGLPDRDARKDLIIKLLDQLRNSLTAEEIDKLAELTDGYSAPDFIKLAKVAAFEPVYDLCNGQSSESIEEFSCNDARPMSFTDLSKSIEKIKPRCKISSIKELVEWGQKNGVI